MGGSIHAALFRRDQDQAVFTRHRQQLGVEQIGFDRVRQGHFRLWHLDNGHFHQAIASALDRFIGAQPIFKRMLVAEQDLQAGDCNHVIMEGPSFNGFPALLEMQDTGWRKPMATRNGFTGLPGLAGREAGFLLAKAITAPDKNLHPCYSMAGAQPHVVGGPLVGKQGLIGQGLMNRKMPCVGKDRPQTALSLASFQRAMWHGQKVRRAKMQAAISAIG